MKKILVMVAAAMMTATSMFAQEEQPRHEIGVSYGAGISLIGDGIGNGLTNGIFDAMNGRKWENSRELGTVAVEYFYHLNNPRLAVGGVVTYARMGEDVIYEGEKEGERTRNYMSVMPAMKYYWVNKKYFGFYSKAAAGFMYAYAKSDNIRKGTTDKESRFNFMFQASLVGLEGGSTHIRGFFEAGVGEQGIILAGARYRF